MIATVPHILASNFDGMLNFLLIVVLVIVALAAVSFIFTAQGHWVGLLLAGPAAGMGLLFFFSIAIAHAPFIMVILSLLPLGLGMGSIALWAQRRPQR